MERAYQFSAISNLRRFVKSDEASATFLELRRPTPMLAWIHVATNWGAILGCWVLLETIAPAWFIPLALVIVASRQRALNNIIHDASHYNLFKTRRWNALFATVFSALPLGESYELYRNRHMMHHAHLGDPKLDPDFQAPPPIRPGRPTYRAWQFFSYFLLNRNEWRSSLTGAWERLDTRQRAAVVTWWAVVLGAMALTVGMASTLAFFGLWIGSRLTTYHLFRVFAEISDHIGLESGLVEEYTRNVPSTLWNSVFHPFNDNYHLTHHLFPNVPVIRLRRLHHLLLRTPEYARHQLIDGYFTGTFPLIRSWVDSPSNRT